MKLEVNDTRKAHGNSKSAINCEGEEATEAVWLRTQTCLIPPGVPGTSRRAPRLPAPPAQHRGARQGQDQLLSGCTRQHTRENCFTSAAGRREEAL